jgi:GNAT superfamily N-acetyltransferase
MNVKIEKALASELDAAAGMLKELYIELGEESESVAYLTKNLLEELTASGTQIYLAKLDGGEITGFMTLTECQAIYAGGRYGLLDEMYIKPEYRSKDIGAELVKEAKNIGLLRKWSRIDVTAPTEERWVRTVKFYEKCGFVFTGPKMKLKI